VTGLEGPLFAPKEDAYRKSLFGQGGGHYNIFKTHNPDAALELLRICFPDGVCTEDNFVLFSTSGVHGGYATIEYIAGPQDPYPGDPRTTEVTFLLVQPRLVSMTYGNVRVSPENVEWLKGLRQSSWDVVQTIGESDE